MPKQLNIDLSFNADTSRAKREIQELKQQLDGLMSSSISQTSFQGFSSEIAKAQQSVIKLQSALNNSLNADTGKLDLSKFNQQLLSSDLTINKLAGDLSALGPEGNRAFVNLANSIVTAQKPMIETNKLLSETWTALKNTARWQLSSSILHGFISSLQGAFGYAQNLNKSLNSIRIVSGQTVEQMADFAEHANKAAQALSTSTLAYTDAALIFYQQGLEGEEVDQRVETVLKLSNVTGESADSVSSYMTAIWNNFYDGSESLESYADKITALGAATASSSEEIANGMQQFAAVAETVGLSYDYAATALATVVAQTRQSESVVGNSFRTIFSRLQGLKLGDTLEDGTDLNKYSEALSVVGVNIKDQNGQLKDMDTILDEIGAKWKSLAKDQQIALAQTVGGVRQYTNLVALFDNWEQFQKNLTVTQDAEGALQEQADIYAESWEAAQKRVKAAWQAIYQDLLDDKFFIWITNVSSGLLKTVDGLIDSMGGLKGLLFGLIAAWTTWKPESAVSALDGVVDRLKHISLLGPKSAETGKRQSWASVEAAELQRQTMQELQARKDQLLTGLDPENIVIDELIKESEWYDKIRIDKEKGIEYSEKELNLIKSQVDHVKNLAEEQKKSVENLNAAGTNRSIALRDITRYMPESDAIKFANSFETNGRFGKDIDDLAKLNTGTEEYINKVNILTDKVATENEALGIKKENIEKLIDAQVRLTQAQNSEKNLNNAREREENRINSELEGKNNGASIIDISKEKDIQYLNEDLEQQKIKLQELKQESDNCVQAMERLKAGFEGTSGASRETTEQLLNVQNKLDELNNKNIDAVTDEDLQEIEQLKATFDSLSSTLGKTGWPVEVLHDNIKKLASGLQESETQLEQNTDAAKRLENIIKHLEERIEETNNTASRSGTNPYWLTPEFTQNVIQTTRAMSSLVMGINSLKAGFDALGNSDLSWWERISRFTTSFAMSLGMLANSFKAFNIIERIKGIEKETTLLIAQQQLRSKEEIQILAVAQARHKEKLAIDLVGKARLEEEEAQILSLVNSEKELTAEQAEHLALVREQKDLYAANAAKEQASIASLAHEIQTYKETASVSTLSAVVTVLTAKLKELVLAHPLITALAVAIGALGAVWAIISNEEKKHAEAIKAEEDSIKSNKEAVEQLTNAYENLQSSLKTIDEKRKAIETMKKGTQEWSSAVGELNAEMLKLIDEYDLIGGGKTPDYIVSEGIYKLTEAGQQKINEAAIEDEKQARILQLSTERQDIQLNASNNATAVKDLVEKAVSYNTGKDRQDSIDKIINLNEDLRNELKSLVNSNADTDTIAKFFKEQVQVNTDAQAEAIAEEIKSNSELKDALIDNKEAIAVNTEKMHEMQKAEMYDIFGADISDKTADFLAGESEKFYQQAYDSITKVTDVQREEIAKIRGWTQDANGNWKNGEEDVKLSDITDETVKDYLATQQSLIDVEEKFSGQLEAIEAEMRKLTENELIAKITTNAVGQIEGEDYKADVENWIRGLDAEGLDIVANLDIDYKDSLENIQNKYREALSSKPIELDTSGFTKKQAAELQEEFENLTDYIYKNADAIDDLDNHLIDCRRESSKVAKAIMRMDDAIQDVTDNYDAWNAALTSGSWQESVKAANDMGKAYGNLLDLDGDQLSDQFRSSTENLALMKSAIEGNEESYKKLQQAASKDLITKVYFEEDAELQAKFLSLSEKLQGIADNNNIKVGADLSTEPIYEELQELVKNCGLTAEEATNLLASMGVDAEVVSVPPKAEQIPTTETYWVPAEYEQDTSVDLSNAASGPHTAFKLKEGTGYWKTETGYATTTTQGASSLKLISAHKSTGGDIKYKNASNGGGSGYTKKSSGGSKSSSSKKSTEKPKEITKKNEEEDRYHNIKEAIDDLTRSLDRLNKNKDRAFGRQRLKYLDEEIKKTKEQVKLTEDYIKEIKQYQKIDRGKLESVLSSMGMSAEDIASQFDSNGVLKDYEQLFKDLQTAFNEGAVASLNKIEEEYNKAAEAWNASDQGDAAKAVWEAQKERLSNAQEIYKQQEETFKEQIEALKQYEETTNLLQEKQEELIDLQNKVYDQMLEVVKTKLEWKIELHENDRKLLEWVFKYIGDSADYAADKIANLSEQFDTTYKDIQDTQTAIQEIFANHGINDIDFSSGNGDELLKQLDAYAKKKDLPMLLTAEEVKTFEEYTQKLMEDYDKLEEKAKEIHQTMLDATSEWLERIDKEVNKIDTATDKMQFLLDVINLTGKKDLGFTDEEVASFRQQRVDNAQAKVELSAKKLAELQREADRIREELAKATDENSRKRFQNDLDEYTKMIEEASADWRDAYIKALEEAQKATEENLEMMVQTAKDSFGKFGLDFAQEQFARIKELSELYLPDYKKYSELNKSTNELKKSLQQTNNTLIKGKMNDLLDEINEKMNSGVQMSETEAGIIERRVALLQAEAQLRDAQNAKSAVRMTRDNEGNFSYTYTADQNAIDSASENYQERFRELMEYEQDALLQHQEHIMQLEAEYAEAFQELASQYDQDSEIFKEKLAELNDYYQQQMEFDYSQMQILMDEQARLRDDDWRDVERILGLKLAEEDNFTTFFGDTIFSRVSGYETMEEYQQHWSDMTSEVLNKTQDYWNQWKENNDNILAGFRENALAEFDKVQKEVEETKKSAEDMIDTMSQKFDENIDKTSTWEQEVGSKMSAMRDHITQTVSTINDMIAKLGEIGNDINNTANSAEQAAARLQQAAAQAAFANSIINGANGGGSGGGGSGTPNGEIPFSNNNDDTNTITWYDAWCSGSGGPWHASASTKEEINRLANNFALTIYNDTFIQIREFVETLNKGRRVVNSWTIQGKLSKDAMKGTIGDFGFGGKFDSGGYTGDWGNSSGKLAVLHSKELVLNKEDTENMLNAVQLVRQIVAPQLSFDLGKGINYNSLAAAGQGGVMEQQVHIDASFPNVQSHTEIELALNNLINSATQYVNRKK